MPALFTSTVTGASKCCVGDLFRHRLRAVWEQVVDDDPRAFARELDADLPAHALAAAGHQRDLAFQSEFHVLFLEGCRSKNWKGFSAR
jgi:hypothetical protein